MLALLDGQTGDDECSDATTKSKEASEQMVTLDKSQKGDEKDVKVQSRRGARQGCSGSWRQRKET